MIATQLIYKNKSLVAIRILSDEQRLWTGDENISALLGRAFREGISGLEHSASKETEDEL